MQRGLAHALPLFLVAGLCLSGLDATAKYLVRDHSLLLVVWARYAGQMLFVTPFAWHRAGHVVLAHATIAAAPRALADARAARRSCFFGGLRYLPLAEASAITFLAPMFIVALSWPLLGEHAPAAREIASIAGFVGILILLRPGSAVMHPAVLLLVGAARRERALPAADAQAARREPAHDAVLQRDRRHRRAVAGAARHDRRPAHRWNVALALFLLMGLLAGLGHWCLTHAYMHAPASLLTPFTYLQILWATALGFVVFGQHPDGVSAVGMAIIVASGLSLALWERRRRRLL